MRRIFLNPEHEKQLMEKGYFTLSNVLTPEQVADCIQVYQDTDTDVGSDKYNTLEVDNYDNRKSVYEQLNELIGEDIKKPFDNYKFLGYNFAVKKAGSNKEFPAHIDDIHADEALYTSVNVWVPLVDVDDKNGALYMLDKSHLLPQPIRGIGLPFPFQRFLDDIHARKNLLHLKAGDAIFFHTKMVHGSPPNLTNFDRPAMVIGLIPEEAEPILYVHHNDLPEDKVELFEAPPEIFLRLNIGKRPEGFKSYGLYHYEPSEISREEFLTCLS